MVRPGHRKRAGAGGISNAVNLTPPETISSKPRGLTEDDEHHIEALWFIPEDPVAISHEHLGMDHILHGDLPGAEAQFASARRRADKLGFPQGPYNHVLPSTWKSICALGEPV